MGRKEEYKEITGKETKLRIFVNPQTGDEAEPDLPRLEYLANGYNLVNPPDGECKMMTTDEIISRGTLLQKIRLFISNVDLNSYFEAKEELTSEQRTKIITSIHTDEDIKLLDSCLKEYDTLSNFGRLLSYFFKRFQTSCAILAVLLNRWDAFQYTAKQLTTLYGLMKYSFINSYENGETIILPEKIYSDNTRKNFIKDLLYSNVLEGASLKFDKRTESFHIDIKEKGGLYSQILEEAKSATKDLSDFKAYAIVAEDYINKSTLKYMPISIQQSIENAETERYIRFLVKNKSYFKSDLNQRIMNGEDITPEDKRKAFIPDYLEVKPSRNVLRDCSESIKNM